MIGYLVIGNESVAMSSGVANRNEIFTEAKAMVGILSDQDHLDVHLHTDTVELEFSVDSESLKRKMLLFMLGRALNDNR